MKNYIGKILKSGEDARLCSAGVICVEANTKDEANEKIAKMLELGYFLDEDSVQEMADD